MPPASSVGAAVVEHLMFDVGQLPQAEQDSARHLEDKIQELDSYDRQFAVALALFDHADALQADPECGQNRWVYSQWKLIAARDIVLTGYHFRSTLHSLRANLEKCPTLLKQISTANIEAAIAELDKAFPALVEVRHAVGHSADQTFSPADQRKHTFITPNDASVFISSSLFGKDLVYTRNGQQVSFPITAEAAASFRKISDLALTGF